MGIDLALQHPILQVLFLLLIGDTPFKQRVDAQGEVVDPLADVPELIVPFYGRITGEVTVGDGFHFFLDFGDRSVEQAIEQEREQRTEQKDDDQDDYKQREVQRAFEADLGQG